MYIYIYICIYMYIYVYIYIIDTDIDIKHIHWLNLNKGRWKRPDFIRKLITTLMMSSFKEIELADE